MFCVVVCSEDIVSNFEAEQFGKLVFLWVRPAFFLSFSWGGSRGGSGGSVEPPKLDVKTYNKRVVKEKVNQLS